MLLFRFPLILHPKMIALGEEACKCVQAGSIPSEPYTRGYMSVLLHCSSAPGMCAETRDRGLARLGPLLLTSRFLFLLSSFFTRRMNREVLYYDQLVLECSIWGFVWSIVAEGTWSNTSTRIGIDSVKRPRATFSARLSKASIISTKWAFFTGETSPLPFFPPKQQGLGCC